MYKEKEWFVSRNSLFDCRGFYKVYHHSPYLSRFRHQNSRTVFVQTRKKDKSSTDERVTECINTFQQYVNK